MDVTIKHKGYEKFITTGSTEKINADFSKKLRQIFATISSADSLNDIMEMKALGCHELKGDRKGEYAITINGPWRVVFKLDGKSAYDVDIENYH
ncbi:type II toxin-antitoxin system RelE/ParE family toxin [Rahnella aceris]|uniref:Type II toxin-antitoxin system RelE/ParE family toxin n=1 Tax=Rahnella sp. (strain Y9602) TaxID=2703885 RepID=A0ABW6CK12_RAHSY